MLFIYIRFLVFSWSISDLFTVKKKRESKKREREREREKERESKDTRNHLKLLKLRKMVKNKLNDDDKWGKWFKHDLYFFFIWTNGRKVKEQ